MLKYHGTVLALLVLSIVLVQAEKTPNLEITARRFVDSTTQFVTELNTYEITNTGKSESKTFDLAFVSKNLGIYEHKVSKGDVKEEPKVLKVTNETHDNIEYLILTLEILIEPGETVTLATTAVYTHVLAPLPKEITQREPQLMILYFNHYIASPYVIQSQVSEFRIQKVISHSTHVPPVSEDESSLTFGEYTDIQPWSFSEGFVHHQNMAPFLTITKLIKEIEISHWGNVAIEEWIWLQNDGAHLKGGFSRLDLMNGAYGNGVPRLVEWLPHGATDVYFRDVIGNISSSHVFPHEKGVKFEINPRFVLFGGWKTEFYTGHNLPASEYITIDENGRYSVQVPFVNEYEQIVVDHMEIRVILPEGAVDVRIETPLKTSELEETRRYTYLDTTGRLEIRFSSENLVPVHRDLQLVISYQFQKSFLVQEPLLLIGGFFALFLAMIVLFRLNFSISESTPEFTQDSIVEEYFVRVRAAVQNRDETLERILNQKSKKLDQNQIQTSLSRWTNEIKQLIDQLGAAKATTLANDLRDYERAFERKLKLTISRLSLESVRNPDQKKISEVIDKINEVSDELSERFADLVAYF